MVGDLLVIFLTISLAGGAARLSEFPGIGIEDYFLVSNLKYSALGNKCHGFVGLRSSSYFCAQQNHDTYSPTHCINDFKDMMN